MSRVPTSAWSGGTEPHTSPCVKDAAQELSPTPRAEQSEALQQMRPGPWGATRHMTVAGAAENEGSMPT